MLLTLKYFHELTLILSQIHKIASLYHTGWPFSYNNSLYFLGTYRDSILGYNMPKNVTRSSQNSHMENFANSFSLSRSPKQFSNVVKEYHHEPIQEGLEFSIHQIHKISRCIHQLKRHHKDLIMPIMGSKCNLHHIFFRNLQLLKSVLRSIFENT